MRRVHPLMWRLPALRDGSKRRDVTHVTDVSRQACEVKFLKSRESGHQPKSFHYRRSGNLPLGESDIHVCVMLVR